MYCARSTQRRETETVQKAYTQCADAIFFFLFCLRFVNTRTDRHTHKHTHVQKCTLAGLWFPCHIVSMDCCCCFLFWSGQAFFYAHLFLSPLAGLLWPVSVCCANTFTHTHARTHTLFALLSSSNTHTKQSSTVWTWTFAMRNGRNGMGETVSASCFFCCCCFYVGKHITRRTYRCGTMRDGKARNVALFLHPFCLKYCTLFHTGDFKC